MGFGFDEERIVARHIAACHLPLDRDDLVIVERLRAGGDVGRSEPRERDEAILEPVRDARQEHGTPAKM